MNSFKLQDILAKLSITAKIDKEYHFLKGYDKNHNSIFDADEIEAIKRDLTESDKTDGKKDYISESDLLKFYNKAMQKFSSSFSESKNLADMENVVKWINSILNNPSENTVNNQNILIQEFMNIKREDSILEYEVKELLEKITPDKVSRAKELLGMKIGKYKGELQVATVIDMLNLETDRQELMIKLLEENDIKQNRYDGVLKLIPVYEYLPQDFFNKYPDFYVKSSATAVGFQANGNSNEVFLYKPGTGLVETQSFNPTNNTETIINTQLKQKHTISYNNGNERNESGVISETVSQYDSLEFDAATGNPVYGNMLRTTKTSSGAIEGIPNITVFDPKGNAKPVQYSIVHKDGSISVFKDFVSPDGVKTEYYYEESADNVQIMTYKITDKNGQILLDKNQTIQQISNNKVITSSDGNIYEAVFEKNKLIITDKSNNTTKTFDISSKFITEGKNVIIQILKQVQTNLLMVMDNLPIQAISYDQDGSQTDFRNNARWNSKNKFIQIGYYDDVNNTENAKAATNKVLSVFLHEYGHYLDSEIDSENNNAISGDSELNAIFEEEFNAFIATSDGRQQAYISYFTEYDKVRAAQERVAEGNMLLNTIPNKQFAIRSQYYQQNFPRTIAKIQELLNKRQKELTSNNVHSRSE